jgi:hypothetical protein
VAFEAELALRGPDDRLDPLAQPAREVPRRGLVLADRADQGQAQVRAGEERLGALAGQALAGDDGGARCRPVRRLALQRLPGLLALAEEPGVGQGEPGDGPVAGADEQQLFNIPRVPWLSG